MIVQDVCWSAVYESTNSVYIRCFRGENLWCTKVQVVVKPNVSTLRTACSRY